MTQQNLRHLNEIVQTYGKTAQVDVAIEECSELIKALLKERRKLNSGETVDTSELRSAIIDEIADVLIMATQLEIIYECMGEVDNRINFKIQRQMERMKKAEQETEQAEAESNDDSEGDYVSDVMMRLRKNND